MALVAEVFKARIGDRVEVRLELEHLARLLDSGR
jgi:hypothetical protein